MTTTENPSSKPLKVLDHNRVFEAEAFQQQFENKRQFENACESDEVARVREWTKTWEYRERNFAREALTVNPAKACQPLGAVLAGLGFAGTLPLVHGSQGCVAYFRSHFARHFKEPVPTVSSSMTEDAAVFGGLNNLVEALQNSTALYRPDMVAVSSTCMAEVIGDDLAGFIGGARTKGAIAEDFPVPSAHTPSFVGSHVTGYDNMLRSILEYLAEKYEPVAAPTGPKLNIVPGFDTYVGNHRELRRILGLLGVDHTIIGDHSASLDSPAQGEYVLYPGGTPLAEAAGAKQNTASLLLAESATIKTAELIRSWGQETVVLPAPIGIRNTDKFISEVARLTGVRVPAELVAERGRLVDAFTDSHAYLHGKRVALAGDPDLLVPLTSFLLELGMVPVHIVCTNADHSFEERIRVALDASPFGTEAKVWPGKDLWHLRSLVFTEPVDLLVGSTYLKFLSRDAGIPLFRVGFPIFDRHHLHRFPIVGYEGGLQLLTQLVNTVLDELDRTSPDHSFDPVR